MYFLYDNWKAILKIQKFRRVVSYTGFYCFVSALSYWYTNNTTRAGTSRGDQFYASFPAGTELLTDTAKLYKAALGNCFEIEEWGPIEYSIMAKHFDRQGKPPYAYHSWCLLSHLHYSRAFSNIWPTSFLTDSLMEVVHKAIDEIPAVRKRK